jgi:hypothetical protein
VKNVAPPRGQSGKSAEAVKQNYTGEDIKEHLEASAKGGRRHFRAASDRVKKSQWQ